LAAGALSSGYPYPGSTDALWALPIYRRIAAKVSGEGSIVMLEHLLPWWQASCLCFAYLFVATDFIITITLSSADATAHIIENPLIPGFLHNQEIGITLTGWRC